MEESANKSSHDFTLINIHMLWIIVDYTYYSLEILSAASVKIFLGLMHSDLKVS